MLRPCSSTDVGELWLCDFSGRYCDSADANGRKRFQVRPSRSARSGYRRVAIYCCRYGTQHRVRAHKCLEHDCKLSKTAHRKTWETPTIGSGLERSPEPKPAAHRHARDFSASRMGSIR